MKSNIKFANEKIKKALEDLEKDDFKFYQFIIRAFNDIQENCFCGVQIPKRLIPEEYIQKFNVRNVWKYNLPNAWRLVYSVEGQNLLVFSIILEWMDHKTYERKFHY